MNEIIIFSYKVARDVIQQQKFKVLDIRPNHKVKNATVTVFEDTEELREYLLRKWNIRV